MKKGTAVRIKAPWKVLGLVLIVMFIFLIAVTIYKDAGGELPDEIELFYDAITKWFDAFKNSFLFGAVFITVWLAVCYQKGKKSGWQKLAKRYHHARGIVPDKLRFIVGNGRVGNVDYSIMLKVAGYRGGLIMKVMFPFRFGNPNLYIPWTDIDTIVLKRTMSTDDNLSNIENFFARLFHELYAHIRLAQYPDQILIVPWREHMDGLLPGSFNLKREIDN